MDEEQIDGKFIVSVIDGRCNVAVDAKIREKLTGDDLSDFVRMNIVVRFHFCSICD